MKKLILSALFVFFVSLSGQASASAVSTAVQSAISSNNFDSIATFAAGNPAAQGELAMYLLQQAQAKLATNPALAAKLFQAAAAYVAQIPAAQAGQAANIIASVVSSTSSKVCQAGGADPYSTILAAALSMSNQPNIIAANANLHATVLASADAYVAKSPECAGDNLKQTVLLAQTPGISPTINNVGAHGPSAE